MGAYAGPDINENGLVLALDAANVKSYLGYWSPTLSNGANAFDGSLSTAAGILGGTFGPYTYTFANPIAITSARMYVAFGASSSKVGSRTNVFLVNGIDVTQKAKDANAFGNGVGSAWIDVTTEAGSNWNTFQFTGTGGSTNPGIYAIEINGKIIVGNYNGTTWTDLSGNGNNGTLVNGVGYNSSNLGSLTFDGVNDYISGSISTLANWSISLWHLSKDITSQVVFYPFSCNTGSSRSGLGFGGTFNSTTNGRWYFYDGTTIFSNSNTSITTNVWYNLVVTKNSTTYNLYTNGSFSYSFSGVEISYTNYNIGRRTDDFWYSKGNIAQVSIYNRALTSSEVQKNFNATRGRFGL